MCRNACVNEHADHQLLKRVQVAATCHLRPDPGVQNARRPRALGLGLPHTPIVADRSVNLVLVAE